MHYSFVMKTATKNFSIDKKFIVYATPVKVFEALTDPGIVAAWGGGLSVVENKIGGKFELFDGWVKGEILSFKHGEELSYSWKPTDWSKKDLPSTVVYKLREHPAGTEVALKHSGLPSEEECEKHENGWIDYVFDPMNDYFAQQL